MTITTKKNANGKITAYYIDGKKVRKGEVEYYACNPAYDGIIEIDYYTAKHNFPNLYNYGTAVVFKNWVDGSNVMTKAAADRLGLKLGKKISLHPAIYRVVEEVKTEYKPQCNWENPHNYETTGADHARNLDSHDNETATDANENTPVSINTPDAKAIFDKVVKVRRHGIRHLTTKQGYHMWFIWGGLISKQDASRRLAQHGFTIDEFIAAESIADKYEEEIDFPRFLAIRKQADFLKDKIDRESKPSVDEMPALFPVEVGDLDDELIDPPVTTHADDFEAELEARYEAFMAAQPAEVKELNAKLAESTLKSDMWVHVTDGVGNLYGCFIRGVLNAVRVEYNAEPEGIRGYTLRYLNDEPMEIYDTFAQVKAAIEQFKAAIERGDSEFTFPTVDELTEPEIDKTATADSLTRAMTIALEKYQDFCRVGNLTAATNELSLYNICRKAMTELWKEEAA